MKKLIIATLIVGVAAVSQAASFSWSLTSALYGVDAANVSDNGSIAASTTYGARNHGSWSWMLQVYDAASGDLLDSASGKFATIPVSGKPSLTGVELADVGDGVAVKYIMTLTGEQTDLRARGVDAGKNFSQALLTAEIKGTLTTETMGDTTFSNAAPSSWTVSGVTSAVPEPTSGLMLLLGIGLMTLRRRRA